jgi:hypothetical protein
LMCKGIMDTVQNILSRIFERLKPLVHMEQNLSRLLMLRDAHIEIYETMMKHRNEVHLLLNSNLADNDV